MKKSSPHSYRKYLTLGVFSLVSLTLFVTGALYANGPSALWTRCAGEGETCILNGSTDVAYGANGYFLYQTVDIRTNSIRCTNSVFWGDPIFGTAKACYKKVSIASVISNIPLPWKDAQWQDVIQGQPNGFVIARWTSQEINVHSECKKVTAPSGLNVFVPTRDNILEWKAFKDNAPGNIWVTLADCVVVPSCNNNGIRDNGETGVDCGGGNCGACSTLPINGVCSTVANQCSAGTVGNALLICESTNAYPLCDTPLCVSNEWDCQGINGGTTRSCATAIRCSTPGTCSNGATNYPTCTLPTCANGALDYPTCTPPVTPTCANGGLSGPVSCPTCANGWLTGATCSGPPTCANGWLSGPVSCPTCANGGIPQSICNPTCANGWLSGPISCPTCANGGITDPAICSPTCANGWLSGPISCPTCANGWLTGAACSGPPTCANGWLSGPVSCPTCANGGIPQSTCNPTCANGGITDPAICSPTCANGGLSGPISCPTCANGGIPQSTCNPTCANGGITDPAICNPTCANGWITGAACNTGSWTAGSCSATCGGGTIQYSCTGGNGICNGSSPTTSCNTQACPTCNWTPVDWPCWLLQNYDYVNDENCGPGTEWWTEIHPWRPWMWWACGGWYTRLEKVRCECN